jgi:hypothetical protein
MLAGQGGHFLIDFRPHHREAFSTMAKKGEDTKVHKLCGFCSFGGAGSLSNSSRMGCSRFLKAAG